MSAGAARRFRGVWQSPTAGNFSHKKKTAGAAFYLTMLKARKERILDLSLERPRSMKIDQKMQRSPVSLSR